LLNELKVVESSRRPDVRLLYDSVAEELFPVLARIVPRGAETLNFVDYTASRIVRRRKALKNIPSREVPATLIYTLHDDNVGVLPQLATGSLHELTKDLRRYGWAGFSTRYWIVGDHDPCVAYLARAAWDATTTPEGVYRDQVRAVCVEASVEDMLAVFREVETATVGLEDHGLGLTFPMPDMMLKHWIARPFPAELAKDRSTYQSALAAARRARAKSVPAGRTYVDYWLGRLEFGIGYLDTIEKVHQAAEAEAKKQPAVAARQATAALATFRRAMESYAGIARDQSDRGTLATLAEFAYRPLAARVARLAKSP
jgi:hypothetical protein